jgi:hypothetical protein
MDDDFDEVEHFTRDGALEAARAEAQRDLIASDASIRYVAFVPEFEDYCLCEFVREEEGWVKVVRLLTPAERLPREELPDARIIQLGRSGNLMSAIRLYRAKHRVGLLEGKLGVEALLKQAEPGAAPDRRGM